MTQRNDIWPPGFDVTIVEQTGSTNADLLVAGANGAPHGTVLVADHQTAGRGRYDRTWEAPPGSNLLMSVLFRDRLDPLHALTQRVAVGAVRACQEVGAVTASIKWPNDLLLDGRKLAGILAQAGGQSNRVDFVVVGIGLNIGWAPDGAARLPSGTRDEVLAALLRAIDLDGGEIFEEYRSMLGTLGADVKVELPEGDLVGTAVDVQRDGRLVVLSDGERLLVSAGDVVHVRPAAR